MKPSKNKNSFVHEYVYVEDMPLLPIEEEETADKEKTERGIFILDLFSDE